MKQMILTVSVVVAIIAIILGNSLMGKFVKNAAIDGCLQAGRLEFTNGNNQKANVPDNYWYDDCMSKKGYKIDKDK
jgi:hypothetical protein